MKIYFAGYGHAIEKTEYINTKDNWNFLLSYYYLEPYKDKGMFDRWNWLIKQKIRQRKKNG